MPFGALPDVAAAIEPGARFDVIGHSLAAETGASQLSYGAMHKLAQLFPARFRNMALAAACAHQPGASGAPVGGIVEGGWGWVYSQYPNTEKTIGVNTTLNQAITAPYAGGTSTAVISSAGYVGGQTVVVGRGATAEVVMLSASADGTHLTFLDTLVNNHSSGEPVVAIPDHWGSAKQLGTIAYAINDLAYMGPTTFATVFPHVFRALLSRYFQAALWEDDTKLIRQTSGTWASTTGIAAGFASGTSCLTCTADGSVLTLDFPPVPAGSTLVVGFRTRANGDGALWTLSLDGGANVTIDTRLINGFANGSTRAATGKEMGSVYRFTNVTAGAHTVTVTCTTRQGSADVDFMAVEGPNPPWLLVQKDPRMFSYLIYSAGGWPYTPTDSDVTTAAATTETTAKEFAAVTIIDKDAVLQKQRKYFSWDNGHLNDAGHAEIALLLANAINAVAIPLRNLVLQSPVDTRGWYPISSIGSTAGIPWASGFSNYDATSEPAGYYKDISTGLVVLRGAGKNTTGTVAPGTTMFTLPVGHRPAYAKDFVVFSQAGPIGIRVAANGDTSIVNNFAGPLSYFSLNGITFFAEQ